MSDFWSGALIAIIGSVVGFGISYWRQKADKNSDEKKQTESFLNAIKSEISSIWSRYYATIGESIENLKENEGFGSYYPIFDNYFIVYDNNTNLIGNLDKELSEILVKTYTIAKGLKDSFLCNNKLLNELNRYYDFAQETKIEHYSIQHQTHFTIWQDYGKVVQEMHFKLKESKDILIEKINKELD